MRKISSTIILVIGLFVILSLGTVGILSLSTATKALETETSNRLEAMAQQKSAELEIQLLDIEKNIDTLLTLVMNEFDGSLTQATTNQSSLNTFLDKANLLIDQSLMKNPTSYSLYIVLNPEVFGDLHQIIYVKTPNSDQTQALNTPLSLEDLEKITPEMAWYHAPINKGAGVWSDPYFDKFLEEEIITYSEPIYYEEQLIGIIGTDLLFEEFKTFVTTIKVFDTGYAFLLNDTHDNIVHPTLNTHTNMRTINDGLFIPISNKMQANSHGSMRYKFYGVEKIMGFDRLYNGWTIGIAPPLEEVNASLNSMRQTLSLTIMIAIVIFLILGGIVGKYLSRPIEQLSQSVTLIGQGDLHEPVDVSLTRRKSEIGYLATAIEQMRIKQKEVINELLSHNETLDQKVAERTNELLDINQELEASLHSLKDAQQTIVDMHEQETVNDLVQHITQKLSAPMANTLTAASYLINLATVDGKIGQSAQIIYDSQLEIKQLLISLKQLMDDYTDEGPRHFPIKAFANHTIQNILSESESNLGVRVEGDEQLMATLPIDLTNRLFTNVTQHALRLHTQYNDTSDIRVVIKTSDDWLTLAYHDIIPWQPQIEDRLFNPYYQSDVIGTNSGLELFLIQHLVIKGFQGTIELVESPTHKVILLLNLPQNNTI